MGAMTYETELWCNESDELVAQYSMESDLPDRSGTLLHGMLHSAVEISKIYTKMKQPEGMTFKVESFVRDSGKKIHSPGYLIETNQEGDEIKAYVTLIP